jgi:plastocyanin
MTRGMAVRRGTFAAVALAVVVAASLVGASLALAADHEVAIRAAGFDPPTITVLTGEPVTWTNATEAEHTVTTDDGTLDSGPIGPGEAFGHVF